jgi:hypothetical protein
VFWHEFIDIGYERVSLEENHVFLRAIHIKHILKKAEPLILVELSLHHQSLSILHQQKEQHPGRPNLRESSH